MYTLCVSVLSFHFFFILHQFSQHYISKILSKTTNNKPCFIWYNCVKSYTRLSCVLQYHYKKKSLQIILLRQHWTSLYSAFTTEDVIKVELFYPLQNIWFRKCYYKFKDNFTNNIENDYIQSWYYRK